MAEPSRVPTLHQLCCKLIIDSVINLDNGPFIIDFARRHNVPTLRVRAEKFCCASFRALSERHERTMLEEALGADVVQALINDQADTDVRLQNMRRLGSVVEAPVASDTCAAAAPLATELMAAASLAAAPSAAPSAAPTTAAPSAAPAPVPSARAEAARKRFSFGGGGELCARCGTRVYPAEKMAGVSSGKAYHTSCFRCTTCNSKLSASSYEVSESGELYCKPHFQQQYAASRVSVSNVPHVNGPIGYTGSDDRCEACGKKVFANEKVVARAHQGGYAENQIYHRACFRCRECNRGPLRPGDWVIETETGQLLCQVHFEARAAARRLGASGETAAAEIS